YTHGNTPTKPRTAILLYSNNQDAGTNKDPLYSVNRRGGEIGGGYDPSDPTCTINNVCNPTNPARASVLSLEITPVILQNLKDAALADVNGTVKIPAGNPLLMPGEVDKDAVGETCPNPTEPGCKDINGVLNIRNSAGFFDYSTRFLLDQQNFAHSTSCQAGRFFSDYEVGTPSSGVQPPAI